MKESEPDCRTWWNEYKDKVSSSLETLVPGMNFDGRAAFLLDLARE